MSKRTFCDFCDLEINPQNPPALGMKLPVLVRTKRALPYNLTIAPSNSNLDVPVPDICQTCLDDSIDAWAARRTSAKREAS